MTTYSTDTFNRTNSTTSLGVTDGADALTWTQLAGTWGINSNQAYTSTGASSATAYVDLAKANVDLSVTVAVRGTGASGGGSGIAFRISGVDDCWLARLTTTATGATNSLQLINRASGTNNVITTVSGAADGDVLRVVTAGDLIQVFRNGTLTIATSNSLRNSLTKHGIYIQNNTDGRLDSWSAVNPTVAANLSVTQTQTASMARLNSFGKTLSATQTQVPSVTTPKTIRQTLTAVQVQV